MIKNLYYCNINFRNDKEIVLHAVNINLQNDKEIVAKAIATGTTDLESVYKQVAFDRVFESSKEARQFKDKVTSEQKVMTAAKRQVGVVSGGTNSTSASVTTKPITSLRDAYEAAKRQHA